LEIAIFIAVYNWSVDVHRPASIAWTWNYSIG